MGTELVKISPSVDVSLQFPDNIPRDLVSAAAFAVMRVATVLVREGIHATGAVVQAVEQTRVAIALYQQEGRYLREYVIPTVALFSAVQRGRRFIDGADWDEDLKQMALEDLDRVLQRYRTR